MLVHQLWRQFQENPCFHSRIEWRWHHQCFSVYLHSHVDKVHTLFYRNSRVQNIMQFSTCNTITYSLVEGLVIFLTIFAMLTFACRIQTCHAKTYLFFQSFRGLMLPCHAASFIIRQMVGSTQLLTVTKIILETGALAPNSKLRFDAE